MWVLEASVARESSTCGSGCTSSVVAARAALMVSKDCCRGVDQSSSLGLPLIHSVRGWAGNCGAPWGSWVVVLT